jgi:cysteine desulfurase
MSSTRAYLDWNAGAPLRSEARAAMLAALDVTGNPSSPHTEGRRARAIVEDAREEIAALVGANPAEVVFTSGATEANNTMLAGGWDAILLAGIEHDSVLTPVRALAGSGATQAVDLAIDAAGVLDMELLAERAQAVEDAGAAGRTLLTLQLANNETGVIQPVAAAAAEVRVQGLSVHTDAVQAAGRIPVNFRVLGVDYLSLSAHKLGGPKGVGALVIRDGAALPAFIRVAARAPPPRRTENAPAIAGFSAARRQPRSGVDGARRRFARPR